MGLKKSTISRCYILSTILVLVQLWTVSNGLQCFSCWRFHCVESLDICKEIRHFPSANNQTREVSENWRASPECPSHSDDLYLSRKYVQNCTEEETACGSYFIKVTAAIARNSIGETEYPILITPNYYYSTFIALGCVKSVGQHENKKEVNVTLKTVTTLTPEVHSTTFVSNSTTSPLSKATNATLLNSTTTTTNTTTENNNTTRNETIPNKNNYNNASTSTSEIDLNKNVTKVGHEETHAEKKDATSSSSSTKDHVPTVESKDELLSVAPPLSLPLTHHLYGSNDGHDDHDHHHDYKTDAKSPVVPLENQRSTRKCNMHFSHVENRTSYGTLERINMTAEFSVCSQCNLSLCNSGYPQDDSADLSPSSSSSSPSSTVPSISSTKPTSSASSCHPFSHQYCSVSNFYAIFLVLTVLVTLDLFN